MQNSYQFTDQVIEILQLYKNDTSLNKINCTQGVYLNDQGETYKFHSVKEAQNLLLDEDINFSYIPSAGNEKFLNLTSNLLFDNKKTHYKSLQTFGGIGAIKLTVDLINQQLCNKIVFLPSVTWDMHEHILKSQNIKIEKYKYFDENTKFDKIVNSINNIPNNNIILLQASCHNPTGYNFDKNEWKIIINLCKSKNLFIILDLAYMGFSSGDINDDIYILKLLNDQYYPSIICVSYSKVFGMYSERVGSLFVSGKDNDDTNQLYNSLVNFVRVSYTCPTTFGSNLITIILSDPLLKQKWLKELKNINVRYIDIRNKIKNKLENVTNLDFSDITNQKGLFWYSSKHFNKNQINYIISKHIYILKNSRINLSAINDSNFDYFIDTLSNALKVNQNNVVYNYEEIKIHVINKINNATLNKYPYYNIYIDNIFPNYFYEAIKQKSIEKNKGVNYKLSNDNSEEILIIKKIFNDSDIKKSLLNYFYSDITFVNDLTIYNDFQFVYSKKNTKHEIHVDMPYKLLSIIFYLPSDDITENEKKKSGTMFYSDELEICGINKFEHNTVTIFAPHSRSYHGFDISVDCRCSMILFLTDIEIENQYQIITANKNDSFEINYVKNIIFNKINKYPLLEYSNYTNNEIKYIINNSRINGRCGRVYKLEQSKM